MQATIVCRAALIGGCTLGLLLIAQLEMLAALDDALVLIVALDAFETENNLFRRFRLCSSSSFCHHRMIKRLVDRSPEQTL